MRLQRSRWSVRSRLGHRGALKVIGLVRHTMRRVSFLILALPPAATAHHPRAPFLTVFVFFVLAHNRRRLLHFNVTDNPSAEWTAQ